MSGSESRMASRWYIFFLLSFLGLLSAGTTLTILFWLTGQLNTVEHEKASSLVELKLSETSEALSLAVQDYSYWTFSHELIEAGDEAEILENIGSGATDSALFDQIFILGPEGNLLHAFDEFAGANAQSLFDEDAFDHIWTALNGTDPVSYQPVTSFVQRNGQFSVVAAAWVTPDSVDEAPDAPYAAMFGVVHLDQQFLAELTRQSGITELGLAPYAPFSGTDHNGDSLVISDLNNQPVATLIWNVNSLGMDLRARLLPGIVLIALCMLMICGLAARYFLMQYEALSKANLVATTDQLTGVLNRSGLTAALKTKHVLRSLEKGHLAAIFLDLNKFKSLNDTNGHQAGDIALRVTAERLQSSVRETDFVARMGGDEFICVIIDTEPETAATKIAERILSMSEAPVSFGNTQKLVTPSVGLAISKPGTAWETVLSHADAAMYWAKQNEAGFPVRFCGSMVV